MTKIMILGAHGKMAQLVTQRLLQETDFDLILFLRQANRLKDYQTNQRVQVIEGDVLDTQHLASAMKSADIVYSNLGGIDLAAQITSVIAAMKNNTKKRFVYISSLGAHHEVPGKFGVWNEQAIHDYLPGFRKSADLVAKSGLDYTEIRPAWLTNLDEVDYEVTQLNEPMKGTEVSRKSVADFVVNVLSHPETYRNQSVGLNKPNTAGDKPSWL